MNLPIYKLKALDDFKCLASDCPDDCCSCNWNISVDEDTYSKWQGLEDREFRETLLGAVHEEKIDGANVKLVGSIDHRCILLDENGLCSIHAKLGQAYLGKTCRDYPRTNRAYANHTVNMANMSCPELARLVFDQKGEPQPFNIEGDYQDSDDPAIILNDFVNKVLNKKKHSLAAKVLTISRLLVDLSYRSQSGQLSMAMFDALCGDLNRKFKSVERDIRDKRLKIENHIAGLFWYSVNKILMSGDQIYLEKQIKDHPIMKKLQQKNDDKQFYSELYRELSVLRSASKDTIDKKMGDFGTRYLSVKFRYIGFPLAPLANNYIAAFLFAILPYSFINLCLWVLYDVQKTISRQDIIDIVYKTERLAHHSDRIYNTLNMNKDVLYIDQYESCFSELV